MPGNGHEALQKALDKAEGDNACQVDCLNNTTECCGEKPVDPDEMFEKCDFDPNGPSEEINALLNPADSMVALKVRDEAFARTQAEYHTVRTDLGEANAFQHAYGSYVLSKKIGESEAKKFGDAHERNTSYPIGDTLKDLHNNEVGRRLARDPNNGLEDATKAIKDAIARGELRIDEFKVKKKEKASPASPLVPAAPRG